MSQYGAYGYAQHGVELPRHPRPLLHGHRARRPSTPAPTVRVLLQSARGAARSRGATRAGGAHARPGKTYSVAPRGRRSVELRSPARPASSATSTAPLRVDRRRGRVHAHGRAANGVRNGRYRGALEFRAGAVRRRRRRSTRVGLEDYVRGVVRAESPAVVAARGAQGPGGRGAHLRDHDRRRRGGDGFDQYPDTRSQMYRGVAAETPSTDAGGRRDRAARSSPTTASRSSPTSSRPRAASTENVENSFVGARRGRGCSGVDDPYDDVSPRHRWGPFRMTLAQAGAQARAGSSRAASAASRWCSAASRRAIVRAQVVGSRGATHVTGADLRRASGCSTRGRTSRRSRRRRRPPTDRRRDAGHGRRRPGRPDHRRHGAHRARGHRRAGRAVLAGTITPAKRGAWLRVQRKVGGRWVTYAWTTTGRRGRYRTSARRPGHVPRALPGRAGPRDPRLAQAVRRRSRLLCGRSGGVARSAVASRERSTCAALDEGGGKPMLVEQSSHPSGISSTRLGQRAGFRGDGISARFRGTAQGEPSAS